MFARLLDSILHIYTNTMIAVTGCAYALDGKLNDISLMFKSAASISGQFLNVPSTSSLLNQEPSSQRNRLQDEKRQIPLLRLRQHSVNILQWGPPTENGQ